MNVQSDKSEDRSWNRLAFVVSGLFAVSALSILAFERDGFAFLVFGALSCLNAVAGKSMKNGTARRILLIEMAIVVSAFVAFVFTYRGT